MNIARNFTVLVTFAFLLLFPEPCIASTVSNLVVSNVLERGFTVSWTSADKEKGSVTFGVSSTLGTTASDARGVNTLSYTHYVMIGNLIPSTKYYFTVISGTTTDNNSGSFYTVTTGPVLSVPPSDIAYGKVIDSGNTAFSGAIVYLTIVDSDNQGSSGRSLPMSGISNSSGGWTINLGNSRTTNLTSYFTYSGGDKLEINFLGGNNIGAQKTVNASASKPVADVKIATAGQTTSTPTPTQTSSPTSTPTPIIGDPTFTPTPTDILSPDNGFDFPAFTIFVSSVAIILFGVFMYLSPLIPSVKKHMRNRVKEDLENTFSRKV